MKNARLLALAAATILSGCAQGGVDPFAGASAPPPAEELQYFVRYPDGTIAPVQLPPSVVAGFGAPQQGGGVVYAPPLVAGAPAPAPGQPMFYGAPPPAQTAAVQTPVVIRSGQPLAQPAQPNLSGPPRVAYVGPAPVQTEVSAPAPGPFAAAPAPAALEFPAAPPPRPAAPASGGGVSQMDPALIEALRRQGIDPNEVVGLEYQGGAASFPPPSVVAAPPAAPRPSAAPEAFAAASVGGGMAPIVSPRDAASAAAPIPAAAPTPRPAAPPAAAPRQPAASASGAPQMDPALIEALRRQGIDPSEVVGLQIEGGLAAVPGAQASGSGASDGGPLTRTSSAGAPASSPTPRMSPVRARGDRPAAAAPAASVPAPVQTAAARPSAPAAAPSAPRASGAAAATSLRGSSWRLTMLRGQRVAPGVELHFDRTENFAGGDGPCSAYSFEFAEGAGGALQVDGVGADPRACDRAEEEERYFTALNLVSGYRLSADGNMELLGAGGALLAGFTPL